MNIHTDNAQTVINAELEIKRLTAENEALRTQVADYESRLSAVMPADFKDWHQNSRAEWPEVAAWVIADLREQRDHMTLDLDVQAGSIEAVQAVNVRLAAQVAELSKDAERISFIQRNLFGRRWNGVIDSGSKTTWDVWSGYRHVTQTMIGDTFREALDAAIDAQKGKA